MKKLLALLALTSLAHAQATRTWSYLTSGNGFGFQVFDTNQKKITTFLEHPYRYLREDVDPKSDGVGRRNLAFDFYFGVRGGGSSAWLNTGQLGSAIEYLDQSHIIHIPVQSGAIAADTYYFAPFGYDGNAMIALLHAPGASSAFSLFNFHMGSTNGNPDMPGADGEALRAGPSGSVVETGPGGGAMIYVPLNAIDHADCNGVFTKVTGGQDLADNSTCSGSDVVAGFQKTLGSSDGGWFGVAAIYVDDPATADAAASAMITFVNGQKPDALLAAAQSEFEMWRKPPAAPLCNDDEKKLWRMSEAVLRMGQVREPTTATRKNTGMMLASLPPGEWHTGWVRDGTYGVVALARMGHWDEAKAALNFYMNAGPVGAYKSYVQNVDYRISVVRYYGSGQEQADYSGQPSPNVEIDGWGLVMWAARAYVEASGDVAWLQSATAAGPTVYQTILNGLAKALESNVDSASHIVNADSSIWEVHDANKKHFAYTTMAGTRGFCDFAALAKKAGNDADAMHYAQLSGQIRSAFLAAFPDSKGALAGSLEALSAMSKYYDGAVAEAFDWNLIDPTGATATATLELLNQLRVSSGGFKRNDVGNDSYDNNEWILVDFRIANAMRRAGHGMDADALVNPIIQKAAVNFYLLPELYNAVQTDGQIGKYTGSIPMVGYGGGAYVMTMLDRGGTVEPNDCGDGNGATLPPFSCQGGTGPLPDGGGFPGGGGGPGDNGGGGTPTGAQVPYVSACICSFSTHGASLAPALLALAALALLARRRRP